MVKIQNIHLFKKIIRFYMNLKITRKLLIGYFAIILVPTFLLEWSFYQSSYSAFMQNYSLNKQYSLDIAKQNFDIQLKQISTLTSSFENNTILSNYLLGRYDTASEALFQYFQYISPLYTTSQINPYLDKLIVYGYGTYPFSINNRLMHVDSMNADTAFMERIKRNYTGIWNLSVNENTVDSLDYYKMIYSTAYPYYLGIIRIRTKVPEIFSSFKSLSNDELYLFDNNSSILYKYDMETLTPVEISIDNLFEQSKSYQTTEIHSIGCKIIQVNRPESIVTYDGGSLLILLLLLFIVLTALYYMIAMSITRRLKAFNQHVKKTDASNFEEFPSPVYHDEIGVVITSHNDMIKRIIQLTNENLQSQLQKRDAEYYALQAQIKPHFLYNILENIRMIAETHNDTETADMLLSLGKHLRYSLNMKENKAKLEEELFFADNYLKIQKIRFKDNIQYTIYKLTELDHVFCPRLILQPLIENAIKHGYNIGKVLKISILIKEEDSAENGPCIRIEISDNGNGISKEALTVIDADLDAGKIDSDHHVGLNNVNSRLITFFGSKEGRLYLDSEPGRGTTVFFRIKR